MLGLVGALVAAACGGAVASEGTTQGGSSSGSSSGGSSGSSGRKPATPPTEEDQPPTPAPSPPTPDGCGVKTEQVAIDPDVCELQVSSRMRYYDTCGGNVCSVEIVNPCEADGGTSADGGLADCAALCGKEIGPSAYGSCSRIPVGSTGKPVYRCGGCGVGRPPKGFVARDAGACDVTAETLARIAQLEAASVFAFESLHDDLVRHRAPASLLDAVGRAADDEVRHARAMMDEASRRGATVPDVDAPARRTRTLAELAIENAEEGCVVETFGAALAALQAAEASDPRVRALMEPIAREELAHAALSWELAAWLEEQIDDATRAEVRRARERAFAAVEASIDESVGVPDLGLPAPHVARTMLMRMKTALVSGDLAS